MNSKNLQVWQNMWREIRCEKLFKWQVNLFNVLKRVPVAQWQAVYCYNASLNIAPLYMCLCLVKTVALCIYTKAPIYVTSADVTSTLHSFAFTSFQILCYFFIKRFKFVNIYYGNTYSELNCLVKKLI